MEANKMVFSIIVPVYNVQEYLARCLDSILMQTFESFEIILVDDGSTDESGKICDEYSEKDNRIVVLHKKNGGLSDARNEGLKHSKGDYILFIDSDDWIQNDTLKRFYGFICNSDSKKIDMLIGDIINEDNSLYSKRSRADIGKLYNGKDYYTNFNESIINCSVSSVYRRLFLLENKLFFPKGKLHEDYYFTPKAYIFAAHVVYTGIPFYIRFVRDGSITQNRDKRKNLIDVLELSRALFEYSVSLEDKKLIQVLRTNIFSSYLSKFYDANIYQYKEKNVTVYIDKKLVVMCSYGPKNVFKGLLFVISPRVYMFINRLTKKIAA